MSAYAGSELNDRVTKAIAAHFGKAKPAEPTVSVAPATPAALEEGMVWFSKVFGYTPPSGDFGVYVLDKPADPDVARLIPDIDPDYVVQKKEAALLVAGIVDADKTLVTGPTGSGKSSLVKYVCAKLNMPFIRVNMSGDIESSSLFGTLVVRDGATVWQDGAVTEAVKHGAVCLIDEWELMPAEIAMGMQNLLEDGGYLYLKEKPGTSDDRTIKPHANFRMVFAGNTVGQGDTSGAFSGVGVQNTATIDRFTNTIHVGYLTPAHEVSIITSKSSVAKDVASSMVKVANLIRGAYSQGRIGLTMSPRTLINWARKQKRYDVQHAFMVSFGDKLVPDDAKTALEFYNKVFSV